MKPIFLVLSIVAIAFVISVPNAAQQNVCSKDIDGKEVNLKIVNKTNKPFTVNWVDPNCQEGKSDQQVAPGETFEGISYNGHAFRVREVGTNKLLQVIVANPSKPVTIVNAPPSTAPPAGNIGAASSPTVATKFPIAAGSALKKGVKYPSPSGNHFLVFADDGNVVVATTRGDGFVWGLNTVTNNFSQSARVEVTPDGKLAVYDAKGKALWTSTGKPAPNATLNLTFGGALQLVSATGEILWASDGNISPVTSVIVKANVTPCQADAVWSKCIELPDPKITIRGTKLVSDSAMNAVANVYTELTKRFKPAYPRGTFNGFLVYVTNGEPGTQLDKMKELQTFGENGRGSNSRNLVRGGANYNLLWIEEQMICKAGVRTVNADYPDKADYTLRTYDQVIHEFGHAIDQRYKLGQRIQTTFPGGAPGEDFAWAIQRWFGSPGGALPANQEALMKEIFSSRATFSCEGLKP
ncbi:MAG: hypothetical protein JNM09_02135 [Blastocatellia bacterium]|nr:hypothetical protein [Blastocatellia bacterium]